MRLPHLRRRLRRRRSKLLPERSLEAGTHTRFGLFHFRGRDAHTRSGVLHLWTVSKRTGNDSVGTTAITKGNVRTCAVSASAGGASSRYLTILSPGPRDTDT